MQFTIVRKSAFFQVLLDDLQRCLGLIDKHRLSGAPAEGFDTHLAASREEVEDVGALDIELDS